MTERELAPANNCRDEPAPIHIMDIGVNMLVHIFFCFQNLVKFCSTFGWKPDLPTDLSVTVLFSSHVSVIIMPIVMIQ